MANAYKVLGQVTPAAITNTDLYTVPAATEAVCSTLVMCNNGTSSNVRVAIRPAGAVLATKHYIVYDNYVNANESIFLTLGISLAATDVITVYSDNTSMIFNLFGTEIT